MELNRASSLPPPNRCLHRGWLIKDPPTTSVAFSRARRRFFVLTDEALEWFVDDSDIRAAPHGRMLLDATTSLALSRVSYSSEGCVGRWAEQQLELVTQGERLILRTDGSEGLGEWEAALKGRLERGDLRTRLAEALERERIAGKARAAAPQPISTVQGKLLEGSSASETAAEERAAAAERRVEALEAQLRSLQASGEGGL